MSFKLRFRLTQTSCGEWAVLDYECGRRRDAVIYQSRHFERAGRIFKRCVDGDL